jgi:hypothetical protein
MIVLHDGRHYYCQATNARAVDHKDESDARDEGKGCQDDTRD